MSQTTLGFSAGGEIVLGIRIDTSQVSSDVDSLMSNFRKLELVAVRYLAIARQLGLPDDVSKALNTLSSLIVIMRQVQMTMNLLQIGMGPMGWAMFLASGTLTMMSAASVGYDAMRGT